MQIINTNESKTVKDKYKTSGRGFFLHFVMLPITNNKPAVALLKKVNS